MTILDEIIESKKKTLPALKKPGNAIDHPKPSLISKLKENPLLGIIAEIKRGSPSKGLFKKDLDVLKTATTYEKQGAVCISVLTDTPYFYGSFDDLRLVSESVQIPVLCKDFIISKVQIELAKHHGASVILLIKKALSVELFEELLNYAHSLQLEVLVEVETKEEFTSIQHLPFELCGINNRDLRDFSIKMDKSKELTPLIKSSGRIVITESGIHEREQLIDLRTYGISGALIGETLSKDPNKLSELSCLKSPLKLKICGIKDTATAKALNREKIDYIGLVLCKSKRQVNLTLAKKIADEITHSKVVGVFMNPSLDEVKKAIQIVGLDLVQIHGELPEGLNPNIIIKAQSVLDSDDKYYAYLLDGQQPGSGIAYDLNGLKNSKNNCFLAGGLTIDNVRNRALEYLPQAVDVSSGVETQGSKDLSKIKAFINAVRSI